MEHDLATGGTITLPRLPDPVAPEGLPDTGSLEPLPVQ